MLVYVRWIMVGVMLRCCIVQLESYSSVAVDVTYLKLNYSPNIHAMTDIVELHIELHYYYACVYICSHMLFV